MSAAARLASRAGRHSIAYGGGMGLTILAGIASLAVFTRLIVPGEFGVLALLLALSAALTLMCTLGTLQGVVNVVFGRSEDDDEEPPGGAPERTGSVGRQREALGTGLLLTTLIGAAVAAGVWLGAERISELLFGTPAEATGVRLAGAAGALGAVWRLLQTVPRLERRPGLFVGLEVARPVLAILAALPFVLEGDGPEGVLIGLGLANAVMIVVALLIMRNAYRITFDASLLPQIGRLGAAFVPYGLAIWVLQHGGVLVLSTRVPDAEVGFFRVALTLGQVLVSASSVFFMAWLPLKRTSLFRATHEERGHGWIGGTLATWFLVAGAGLLVVLNVGADLFVRVAGSEYGAAARLIPYVAAAALAQSVFLLAYRIAAFPRKRLALGIITPLAAVAFVAGGVLLVPEVGTRGVPLAGAVAFAVAAAAFVVLGQRGRRPVALSYPKLGATLLTAAACIAAHHYVARPADGLRIPLDVAILLAYPALLLVLRVVVPAELRALATVGRESLRSDRSRRPELLARVAMLPYDHARTLKRALGTARAPADPPAEDVAAALRALSPEAGPPTPDDGAIGRYLVSDLSRAERDAMARNLWSRGVDPAELDSLEHTLDALRKLPRTAWDRTATAPTEPAGYEPGEARSSR